MTIARLPGIAPLAEQFEVFLLDQFGVLHDGTRPYPGAVEALHRLREAGKRTVVLSNSGKRNAPNIARLAKLGFLPDSYTAFLSSGEVAWSMLQGGELGEAAEAARTCFLIARDGDRSPVDGLGLTLVPRPEDADLVLIAASEGDRLSLEHYATLLEPAARRRIPALCFNPDQIMLTPHGPRFGAGRIAQLYEKLGGQVTWIGKPFPRIYQEALMRLGWPDPGTVIGVGDSIEHDVVGAKAVGCRACLVLTGIDAGRSEADLSAAFARHRVLPDCIIASFTW